MPIGSGGMGEVYKARDTRLNRLAALKVLPAEKVVDADRRARFVQEAQAASALNHPHIVTIYGIDRDAGVDFLAMEFVPGRTLDQLSGRRGLKLQDTLRIAIQIADALTAAHAAGIVHRDLKPGNIMVTDVGNVKVLDFGLAKLTEPAVTPADEATRTMRADAPLTERGTILGTISYMSPEQADGRHVDARSDIFSFGSVLYEMTTGRRAFQGSSKMSTISAILSDEPKPPGELSAEPIPRDLEKIIARCLRKDPARRFQHIDDVKVALEELKEESDSGTLVSAPIPSRKARRWLLPLAAGLLLAAGLATVLLMRSRPGGASAGRGLALHQLTQDAGLTTQPAISPDGKLIAYASDRAGEGGLDIWVQQLSRGAQPIRLTRDPADDRDPSFSPDGTQIVFASEREGGGIYVVPSLGGEERLLMRGHLAGPRFSPDGQRVAAQTLGSSSQQILVVPAAGGVPRVLISGSMGAVSPVWSPDGKKILVLGREGVEKGYDWWIIPVDGGPPAPTGIVPTLQKINPSCSGVLDLFATINCAPLEWLGDYVLFSDRNLWRIRLSQENGNIAGQPERLTTGADNEKWARAIPAASDQPGKWRIVFANLQSSNVLWNLPIDLNAARPVGEPGKLFRDTLFRSAPSLSTDGRRLAYISLALETYSLRSRDMTSGAEKVLLQQPTGFRARISPDGRTIAYNPTGTENMTQIYLVPASGGDSRLLCDNCGLIYDWTHDGKSILFRSGDPIRFSILDVSTGRHRVILAHPKYHIHSVELSPDGEWLAFRYSPDPGTPRAVYLVPLHDGQPAGENEWIAVMDRSGTHWRPWWSPDGNVIYFVSNSGGKTEIWAQRLQPATKRPIGEPVRVFSPPGERYSLMPTPWFGPAVGPRNLIFPVIESTGNIWIAE
jgi:Tol biopolymer transport system component